MLNGKYFIHIRNSYNSRHCEINQKYPPLKKIDAKQVLQKNHHLWLSGYKNQNRIGMTHCTYHKTKITSVGKTVEKNKTKQLCLFICYILLLWCSAYSWLGAQQSLLQVLRGPSGVLGIEPWSTAYLLGFKLVPPVYIFHEKKYNRSWWLKCYFKVELPHEPAINSSPSSLCNTLRIQIRKDIFNIGSLLPYLQ